MKRVIKLIPILLIVLFLALFYSYQNGYYEKYTRDKINLTNQKIEEFENDILEGKDITLSDYIEDEKKYETKTGSVSLKVSNKVENIISKGIKFVFRKISAMVE